MLRALCLADAGPRKEDETLSRLARLSPEDYRLVRRDEAKLLGVRLCTLDREVRQKRRKLMGADFKRAFVSSQEVHTYTSPTRIAGLRASPARYGLVPAPHCSRRSLRVYQPRYIRPVPPTPVCESGDIFGIPAPGNIPKAQTLPAQLLCLSN